MSTNDAFLIARRRNEQRLHASGFLSRLARSTGLAPEQISIVGPACSIKSEALIYACLKEGISDGTALRRCHLTLSDAVMHFREALELLGDVEVSVILCRSPDFLFRSRAHSVARAAASLIEFDGDTLTVATGDISAVVVIDIETEVQGGTLYEFDYYSRRVDIEQR
jgi:hypothetical protein